MPVLMTVLSDLPRIVPILTAINQQQQGINGMTPDQVQNELATYPTLKAMTPGGASFGRLPFRGEASWISTASRTVSTPPCKS